MGSISMKRCVQVLAFAGLASLTMAPTCGGGDDPPKGGGGCPAGTKPCGDGCIFTSWICCGAGPSGTGICNPTTAAPGVTDGNCPVAKPGECTGGTSGADSQFCCNPSGHTGSTDCAPPQHFCASQLDPATVCMSDPCCPPGRETELGCAPPNTPPPGGGVGCPSIYDGVYSGDFVYTYGPTHKDPTGATVDDPQKSVPIHATLTLSCLASANGMVVLNVTHANVSEPFFGCADCAPNFGSVANLPATPPADAAHPSASGMGIAILFPNGTSIETTNDVGKLSVSADGRSLSDSQDGTCNGGLGSDTWGSGDVWPKDGSITWCEAQTHWALNKN